MTRTTRAADLHSGDLIRPDPLSDDRRVLADVRQSSTLTRLIWVTDAGEFATADLDPLHRVTR